MSEPQPPEGVDAVMADGTRVPLECVYDGRDHRGMHVWRAVWTLPARPTHIDIRLLPARTSVRVEVVENAEGEA